MKGLRCAFGNKTDQVTFATTCIREFRNQSNLIFFKEQIGI